MSRDTIVERKAYPAGEVIFKQGSRGRMAYIVQEGLVEIFHHLDAEGNEGEKTVLGTIGKGGMFGEMSMIDDRPRMATARTKEATTVIIVTEQMFLHKLKKADPFIRGLMNIMSQTIRSMSDHQIKEEQQKRTQGQ
ncbi:cyclic nucleotide-binding domain-containing protein [Magnetovibrio sp. PR-2]|uniref:Crp/Fnr family transcriptional regulator n=1 Tax=Magnetovibrio sp. PR-2 TaxID=3120356 RepID=UPI002FCE441E